MIRFDPVCCVVAALLILAVPMDWLLSVAAAAAAHEFAHILAVSLLGGKIHGIRFAATGCVIDCGDMEDGRRLLSIAAGPACSLLLVGFRRILPKIAVCGLFQGLFNLLPVLPLDGGRIWQLLLFRFCPRQATAVMNILKYVVWGMVVGILFRAALGF